MIIDLFAGGGGASTGILWATGRHPDVAVNHDPDAIAVHSLNHPTTRHYIEDVWQVDPLEATGGAPVDLLWSSPDCTHFSRAKGAAPVSDGRRGLAGVVIRWARAVRPRVVILENVEEFRTWGPLREDGTPCPERAGETFGQWLQELEGLGYAAEFRTLHAHHYGAPTIRKRLFMVARCDGHPIVWPEPTGTHGTARDCIDWSVPGRSISNRSRPLSEKTQMRIADGRERFGDTFLVPYYGSERGAVSLDLPMRTITTRDRFALVQGDTIRMLTPEECARAQGFPVDYQFGDLAKTSRMRLVGNSVCPPVAAAIVRSNYA